MQFSIPYPPSQLLPNARVHRMQKAHYAKKYKGDCWLITKPCKTPAEVHALLVFYPPDNRYRDLDNALASIKSGIDGLCEKIGFNDRNIRKYTIEWGAVDKGNPHVTIQFKEYTNGL